VFFAVAWLRSDRWLASGMKYKLPLSMRARFTAVRLYWLADVALSALMVLAYLPLRSRPGALIKMTAFGGDIFSGVNELSYPLAAVLLGYFWPQIAAFSVGFGRGNETLLRVSLGQVRDYLLGGPVLEPINSRSSLAVASYAERVVEAATRPGDDSGPLILEALGLPALAADRVHLREALLKKAAEDFEALYATVGGVKMIPFLERKRPLMMVPDMTIQDEQRLYRAGVETIGDLLRGEPLPDSGLSPARLAVLRLGARRLMAQRLWFGFSMAGIAATVIALGSFALTLVPEEGRKKVEPTYALDAAPASSSRTGRP
jgi:hypothetical protein